MSDSSDWEEKTLEPYQLRVGKLCGVWATLEDMVGRLFMTVADLPDSDWSYAMVRSLGFRDQINAIKVGTVARNISEATEKKILESMNYIDNELRNRRNRLVHDEWAALSEPTRVYRIQNGSRLIKNKSFERQSVTHSTSTLETLAALDEAIEECEQEMAVIAGLISVLMNPELEGQLTELPPRRSLRPPPEMPRPEDTI